MKKKTTQTTRTKRGKHPHPRHPLPPPVSQGPRLFGEETTKVLLDLLRQGVNVRAATGKARVSKTQFYEWIKKGEDDPEGEFGRFALDIKEAVSDYQIEMTRAMHSMAAEKVDGHLILKILERRFKEDYATEISHTVTVEDNPFEGKSLEDQLFYAQHGHFPDEPPLTTLIINKGPL